MGGDARVTRGEFVKGGVTGLAVLGLGPLLGACGSESATETGSPATGRLGGEAVFASGADVETFNPQLLDTRSNFDELININEPLIERNDDNELKGLLAESWESVDDETWRLKVRSGVEFHNGEPFNAEAAAYTINRVVDPKFESAVASLFASFKRAEAIDETTVEIKTNGPDPILPARLPYLQVVPIEASQKPDFGENPVGTGPYKFVEWRQGQETRLTAFENYWGGNPDEGLNGPATIKDLVFRVLLEPQARMAALTAGEVDIVRDVMYEQTDRVPKLEEVLGNEHAMIRLANTAMFEDPRIRQAMNYAVDKQAILDTLFGGHGRLLDAQMQNPNIFGYNPNLEPYPFDAAKAKQLAAEAGAEKLSFEILGDANGNWPKDRELVEVVAGQLTQNLGWDVRPRLLNWTKFVELFFGEQGDQPVAVLYSGNEFLDADRNLSAYLTSDGAGAVYENKEIEQKVVAARQELDEGKREQLYHEIHEYVGIEDPMGIFVVQVANLYGLSERIAYKPRADKKMIFAKAKLDA
jgi:peptide/nickel transport system substrate-binding protein